LAAALPRRRVAKRAILMQGQVIDDDAPTARVVAAFRPAGPARWRPACPPPTRSPAMSRLVYVLNGPNLNLLGKRQPHIYGHETLADVERDCRTLAAELGLEIRFHQSNREYELIDWIHEARETAAGIVMNPAAFTHTSIAILDALNTFEGPVIEVHISNVHKREEFRHHSFVSKRADGVIAGFGTQGYLLGLRRVAKLLDEQKE
jgi:3-dehydroquinate dehydratase-2